MDPRTQLTGSPIGQAWTAFRAAASQQNGPPVQYPRQRQLSQLQQDIRSSWRWFLHRSHGLTGHSLKWFQGRDKSFRSWGPMTRDSARQVPQCVGSALQLFPLPSERRHDQKSGNESSGQDFISTRPSLAVNYTAHVADSQRFLTAGPAVLKNQALAQIAKSGGLRFHSELPAALASGRAAGGVGANAGAFLPERGFLCATALT